MILRRQFLCWNPVLAVEPFPQINQLAAPAAEWPPSVGGIKAYALSATDALADA